MNRKNYAQKHGATCKNWTNMSWSFVNHAERFVLFPESFHPEETEQEHILILGDWWETDDLGRKKAGYSAAKEHLNLVLWRGYKLLTFRQDVKVIDEETGKIKVVKIYDKPPVKKALLRAGKCWFTVPYPEMANPS